MPTEDAYCASCGAALQPAARFCSRCGKPVPGLDTSSLPPPMPPSGWAAQGYAPPPPYTPAPSAADEGMATIFPYRNGQALTAYYLGCFSFILPILAIPAVIYGVLGYRRYQEEPRLKGAAHAWIGILAGAFACVLWLMLVLSWWPVWNGY